MPGPLKPTDKASRPITRSCKRTARSRSRTKGPWKTAFQRLLADTGKRHGWFLIPKERIRVRGKSVVPDGTLRDDFNLHRGYWKPRTRATTSRRDRQEDGQRLPAHDTIFEDTRRAVLFQNGEPALEIDLAEPQHLADLLNGFYAYTEPDIEGLKRRWRSSKSACRNWPAPWRQDPPGAPGTMPSSSGLCGFLHAVPRGAEPQPSEAARRDARAAPAHGAADPQDF